MRGGLVLRAAVAAFGALQVTLDAGPEPVYLRPVVSCTSAPGQRSLRVRFIDAASELPLRSGRLFISQTGPVKVDSLGEATIALTDTALVHLLGRSDGYIYVIDTISVAQNNVCDVLLRMATSRGHGF